MKKNELNQIKGLSSQELIEKVKLLRKEIADATVDKNMKKLKDTKIVFKKRKDLAKVLTIIRQKQLIEQLESKISDNVTTRPSKGSKLTKGEKIGLSK